MKLKMRKGQRHKWAASVGGMLRGRDSPSVVTQGLGPLWTDFLDTGRASCRPSRPPSRRALWEAALPRWGQWGSERARDTAPICITAQRHSGSRFVIVLVGVFLVRIYSAKYSERNMLDSLDCFSAPLNGTGHS